MLPLFEAYLACLEKLHADLNRVLEGLPPAGMDWTPPGPEMNSLAVLAAHVAGSERYWVGEIAGGDPAQRDRPAEFRTEKVDGAALRVRLDASLSHSRATLASLTMADLETRRPAMDRDEVTVAWALLHSLEHVATHLGQMQMTRRMWEQQNQA